jgi:hypothetical protein
LHRSAGLISVSDGLGWDGQEYALMLERLDRGTPDMQLRPVIPLLNRPAYWLLGRQPVAAFSLMNSVYLWGLMLSLAILGDRYGIGRAAKVYLVVTLSLSIAVAQMFAFYPALVDLGAYAVVTATICVILSGHRLQSATLAAVCLLSREFALAVVFFGLVRDVRLRARWWKPVVTYLPGVALALAWRMSVNASTRGVQLGAGALLDNLHFWSDPFFVSLFAYFAVTQFGAVGMIVCASPRRSFGLFVEEPEWLAYVLAILAVSAVGSADIWRYLAYLVPVAPVFFARCTHGWTTRQMSAVFALGAVGTWFTQTPFDPMDVSHYFRDWFPYYVWLGTSEGALQLWPVWAWRFLGTVALLWVLAWAIRPDRTEPRSKTTFLRDRPTT